MAWEDLLVGLTTTAMLLTFLVVVLAFLSIPFFVVRTILKAKSSEELLRLYLQQHGCELIRAATPAWGETGPFPRVAWIPGVVEFNFCGVNFVQIEYRIVTFKDQAGVERTRWVRMRVSPLEAHDIHWETGTTEIPNKDLTVSFGGLFRRSGDHKSR